MIGYLEGTVLHRLEDGVVLLTSGGVGYQVNLPVPLLAAQFGSEAPLRLFTVTVVRDNELSLYGFATTEAKALFEMLLKASGVGPKLALAVMSAFGPEELRQAIAQQDTVLLTTIPGVGKKTASRLCIELADRLGSVEPMTPDGRGGAGDLISALTNLGFQEKDVVPVIRNMGGEGLPFEEQLKMALGRLARR